MPSNPRYNLRDSGGNLLGTLYATTNGEIAIHHAGSTEEVILGSGGINVSSATTDRLQTGENPSETIPGTGATLSFTGDENRDIHDSTDVSISNASGASVTEDVTVNYYQGVDNTGTLLESETQSVTLADAASTTVTFLTGVDFSLDTVDYFIEVTTTNLTVDGIDEHTLGAEYTIEQTSTGDLVTTDQNGRERARYDPTSGTVTYPTVTADSASVSNAPTGATDVARQSEIDSLDTTKANNDGGGTETLTNYEEIDTEFATHSNSIDSDHTIPAGKGSVIAGSLSGTGSVSGDGALAVVDEGIHNAVKNPIEQTVDAAGNDITNVGAVDSGSVDAEQINNNAHFVDAADGQATVESAITNASAGDTLFINGDTLLIDSPPWEISKEIHLRGLGRPTIKLADGAYDDNGGGQSIPRFVAGSDGSSIKNFEIDGNVGNQTVSTHPDSAAAHGIRIGGSNVGKVNDITIENVYVHDIVRSNIVGQGENITIRNVTVENSATDHWLYVGGMESSSIENVTCEGYARNTGIVFGTSGTTITGNTLRDVTVKNLAANPHDNDMAWVMTLRNEGTHGDNTIENMRVHNDGGSISTEIKVQMEDTTLRDIVQVTRDNSQIFNIGTGGEDTLIEGCRVKIPTDVGGTTTHAYRVEADDVTLRDVTAVSSVATLRGMNNSGGDRATLDGAHFDVTSYQFRLAGPINEMWTEGVHVENGIGVNVTESNGAVWWAENGYAEESASAEGPQGSYAEGTIVDFTDSGDGSGTGRYLITRANGPVLL